MCIRKTLTEVRQGCTSACRNFSKCQIRLAALEATAYDGENQPSVRFDNPSPASAPGKRASLALVTAS